ncbi:MAG: DoxX family protein [Muribaculaceae bacterium]|nr:DoxX family protein [Muribaculaceae bacterium]
MKIIWYILRKLFLLCVGHTYTNLARLYLRMFMGVMIMQQGLRHAMGICAHNVEFYSILGVDMETAVLTFTILEIVCGVMLIIGLLTRVAALVMIVAFSIFVANLSNLGYQVADTQYALVVGCIGVFFFMLLSGPGKVSLDYVISILFLNTEERDLEGEAELEEA